MITKFNHVAIAVPDINVAIDLYKNILGANVSEIHEYPNHGVSVVFITLKNTKIELMEPLGNASPIKKFLDKNNNKQIIETFLKIKRT